MSPPAPPRPFHCPHNALPRLALRRSIATRHPLTLAVVSLAPRWQTRTALRPLSSGANSHRLPLRPRSACTQQLQVRARSDRNPSSATAVTRNSRRRRVPVAGCPSRLGSSAPRGASPCVANGHRGAWPRWRRWPGRSRGEEWPCDCRRALPLRSHRVPRVVRCARRTICCRGCRRRRRRMAG